MWIKITPFDTLFFRTPRPFSMGADSWAELIFPPYPSTLYGAIRSFLLFRKGKLSNFYSGKLKDEYAGAVIQKKEGLEVKKGKLKIRGIFVFKGNKPIFRTPMDLVSIKGEKEEDSRKKVYLLEKISKPSFMISNYRLEDVLIWKGKDAVEAERRWIGYTDFCNYVKGNSKEFFAIKDDCIFLKEPKVGIKRDRKTLSSEENMLYRTQMIRLKEDVSIVAEISDMDGFPEKGVMQLGGEGRAVFFEKIDDPLKELKEADFRFENKIFKIYLATPALFENGWIPKWINPETYEGEKEGISVKLIACAIGRAVPVGGWDLAKGKAKTLRKAVPEGSVYYFRVLNDVTSEDIKRAFHFKNISDFLSEEGFGLSILGEAV